jgi:hypothetical protein
VSEYVVLHLPLPGVVVTWFVTGSRTSSNRNARSSVLANARRGMTIVPRPVNPMPQSGSALLASTAASMVILQRALSRCSQHTRQ